MLELEIRCGYSQASVLQSVKVRAVGSGGGGWGSNPPPEILARTGFVKLFILLIMLNCMCKLCYLYCIVK